MQVSVQLYVHVSDLFNFFVKDTGTSKISYSFSIYSLLSQIFQSVLGQFMHNIGVMCIVDSKLNLQNLLTT